METLGQLRGLLGSSDSNQTGIVMRVNGNNIEVATGMGLVQVQSQLPLKTGDQVTLSHGVILRVAPPPTTEIWFV